MKNKSLTIILAALMLVPLFTARAQQDDANRYRRLSLCNMLIKHQNEQFADEIEEEFLKIPVSDKYNDHNLSVRVVNMSSSDKLKDESAITQFIDNNLVASRLIAKWFNRDILTGICNMDTIKARGLYDASVFDRELASRSARGMAMLEDAGEDLIGNTYLCMHEITYIDKNKRARVWGAIGQGLLAVAAAYTGESSYADLGQSVNDLVSTLKGFSVRINTRLYRLVWNEEAMARFYKFHYTPGGPRKFENERNLYEMEYIGNVNSKGGTTSFLGINEDEPELMIRKACQRAMDENIADLQKKYEQFRIKTPVATVSPTITAYIGLKEGVTKDTKYEVLEPEEVNGRIKYKRVAVIKPVPTMIWDNRFMAAEEMAYGADFGATTFIKDSGGDITPGMLIREIN